METARWSQGYYTVGNSQKPGQETDKLCITIHLGISIFSNAPLTKRPHRVSSKGTISSTICKCCPCQFIIPGENSSCLWKKPFVAWAPWFAIKSGGIKFLWKMCCLNFKSEINSSEPGDDKQIHLKILLFLLHSRKGRSGASSPLRHGAYTERMFCLLMWDCPFLRR